MIRQTLVLLMFFVLTNEISAQQLLSPSFTYSHSKTAYITLTDGTEITGTIKDIDRKKEGLD